MAIKTALLELLNKHSSTYVSGELLSKSLGVSRAAVWKAIKSLKSEGYYIDAVRNKGYMLLNDLKGLSEASIRSFLPRDLQDLKLCIYDVTDSTNLRAKHLLSEGTIEPPRSNSRYGENSLHAVVLANQQSMGRGRLGRSFFSPQDGLYMSLILKPNFDMSLAPLVTVATAAAVSTTIEAVCNKPAQIKWVNDIYVSNKKVCGILTEAVSDFESGQIESIIIGIGLNTSSAAFPADLQEIAGSIEGEYSRSELAAKVIENTLDYVKQLSDYKAGGRSDNPPNFLDVYRSHDLLRGRKINVYKGVYRQNPADEIGGISARALGIDDLGGLIVAYEDGSRETLRSGEISVRLHD